MDRTGELEMLMWCTLLSFPKWHHGRLLTTLLPLLPTGRKLLSSAEDLLEGSSAEPCLFLLIPGNCTLQHCFCGLLSIQKLKLLCLLFCQTWLKSRLTGHLQATCFLLLPSATWDVNWKCSKQISSCLKAGGLTQLLGRQAISPKDAKNRLSTASFLLLLFFEGFFAGWWFCFVFCYCFFCHVLCCPSSCLCHRPHPWLANLSRNGANP